MEKSSKEKLGPKDFGLDPKPDRERGLVQYIYGGQEYVWHMMDDRRVVLRKGNSEFLSTELKNVMKDQVTAILKPELEKRTAKLSQTP